MSKIKYISKIKDKKNFSLAGKLLIATPVMLDVRFEHAVILLCGHDEQGAMGIVINKLVENLQLSQILEQLDIKIKRPKKEIPIHYGGPIEMGRGFALHSTDYLHESSIKVSDDFALTSNADILKIISVGRKPQSKMLALGYAGWSPGQLETELLSNGWIQANADHDIVFETPVSKKWEKALEKVGVRPEMFSTSFGHA